MSVIGEGYSLEKSNKGALFGFPDRACGLRGHYREILIEVDDWEMFGRPYVRVVFGSH